MLDENLLKRLRSLEWYFENSIKNDQAFFPEHETAKMINDYLEGLTNMKRENVLAIISMLNDAEKKEHYNGTGWLDFKWHLGSLFKGSGFSISFQNDNKLELGA
jgi:hypothetical protein